MRKGIRFFILCFFLTSFSDFVLGAESFFGKSLSAEEAYEYGRVLRAQYRNREARAYLKYAIEKGMMSASYLYAIELNSYKKNIRTESAVLDYVLSAAKSGNEKAIRYLALRGEGIGVGLSSWRDKYFELLGLLSKEDESEADFGYFLYYLKENPALSERHLDKAVALNHPVALIVAADMIKHSDAFYFFASSKERAALLSYKKAAQTGYLPAIKRYVRELRLSGNKEKAFDWLVTAADKGELTSIALVARIFAGLSSSYGEVFFDPIRSKMYYDMYFEVSGRDRFSVLYDSMLAEYSHLVAGMSDTQIAQADVLFVDKLSGVEKIYSADFYWFDDGYFYSLLK